MILPLTAQSHSKTRGKIHGKRRFFLKIFKGLPWKKGFFMLLNVELKILNPKIRDFLPQYQTSGAAGLDLCACLDAPFILKTGESALIPTGLAIYLQNPEVMALIFPRSGLGHKNGIVLGNGTGVIDSDYQGEIKVSLFNRSHSDFTIEPFCRIAQMVIVPVLHANFVEVADFLPSARGAGGFGSTGTK